LDATLRDAPAGLVREQRGVGGEVLAALSFAPPEPLQLHDEPVGKEHVRGSATLRDRGTDAHPDTGSAVRREHVADVEADDLAETYAGAERQADDCVVPDVSCGRVENQALLVGRQRGRG
jgi:hypothetical protein